MKYIIAAVLALSFSLPAMAEMKLAPKKDHSKETTSKPAAKAKKAKK
jgi:hypothetical protein